MPLADLSRKVSPSPYAVSSWAQQTSGVSENLKSLDYYNGMWVAVGDNSTIITSTDDGVTWTPRTSPVSGRLLRTVKYAALTNKWYICGWGTYGGGFPTSKATLLESSDGITWTDISSNVPHLSALVDIAIGPTAIFFVGWYYDATYTINANYIVATNGTVWRWSSIITYRATENESYHYGIVNASSLTLRDGADRTTYPEFYVVGSRRTDGNSLPVPTMRAWYWNTSILQIATSGTFSDFDLTGETLYAENELWTIDIFGTEVFVTTGGARQFKGDFQATYDETQINVTEITSPDWGASDYPWRQTHNSGAIMICGGFSVGKIMTSYNAGSTWQQTYTGNSTYYEVNKAIYNGSYWLAVGSAGLILKSS